MTGPRRAKRFRFPQQRASKKNKISCRTRDSPEIDRRSIYCRHSTEPGKLFFPVRESISVSLSPTSRGIFPSCCVFSSFSCDLILACCCCEGGGGCDYSAVFLAEGGGRRRRQESYVRLERKFCVAFGKKGDIGVALCFFPVHCSEGRQKQSVTTSNSDLFQLKNAVNT